MDLHISVGIADQKITRKRHCTFHRLLPHQDLVITPEELGITHININEVQAKLSYDFGFDRDHALAGLAIMSAEFEKGEHHDAEA